MCMFAVVDVHDSNCDRRCSLALLRLAVLPTLTMDPTSVSCVPSLILLTERE